MIRFSPWPAGAEAPPEIPGGEVHLWCARVDVDPARLRRFETTLSPEERKRAFRLARPGPRRRFVVARAMLRSLLGGYTGRPPGEIDFRYRGGGKPELAAESDLRFSLSHAGDVAVVALHREREIGVDVEPVRAIPNRERIARRYFRDEEQRALAALPPEERNAAFIACWTRKEACSKVGGEGLIPALRRFEVEVNPGASACVLAVDGDRSAARRWFVAEFEPEPGYVGAVAVEGPVTRVRAWHR